MERKTAHDFDQELLILSEDDILAVVRRHAADQEYECSLRHAVD